MPYLSGFNTSATIARRMARAFLALLTAGAPLPSFAQQFPDHAIHMVVPYAAGGSSDMLARLFSIKLSEQFGQPVVVENKAGAGATIGTAYAARSGQGGYTALLADNAQTVAPAMYKILPYDAEADFWPVGFIGQAPAMLFASKASGLKTIADLRDRARKNPEKPLTIGTGNGSPSHLISELFQLRAGVKLQIVPYKGASASLNDLLAGHIDLVFTNPASAAQYLESGKVSVLAQTGEKRDPKFPSIPTFKEAGVPDLNPMYWFALLLPVDTPAGIKARWRKEMQIALGSPEVATALKDLGISKVDMNPEATKAFIANEISVWKKVVTAAGLRAD